MEGADQAPGKGIGGSRWNPTKEQITILEGIYRQGLRTPTAEQIQQITEGLKAHGPIVGKNVFYWFQNHKARQRQKQKQKQKQQSFNVFATFHPQMNPPLFFPTQPNVVCSPCYIPPGSKDALCFNQQHPKVPLPVAGAFKRAKLIPQTIDTTLIKPQFASQGYNTSMQDLSSEPDHRETLSLFPTNPTGILQSKTATGNDIKNSNPSDDDCFDLGNDGLGNTGSDQEHVFIDFFSCGN